MSSGGGAFVPAEPADDDRVEGGVGLSVAAAVEAVAVGLAGRCGDRGDAAQHREGSFGVDAFGVLSDGDQELAGDVGTDTVEFE